MSEYEASHARIFPGTWPETESRYKDFRTKVWSNNEMFFQTLCYVSILGEGFTKCTGVNVGLTNICSMLAKMDCYNAGGGCCATYSDGTGTVSIAEKTSEELCGYCFTGEPGTLEATLEGTECI